MPKSLESRVCWSFWLDLKLELDPGLPSYTPAFDMSDSSSVPTVFLTYTRDLKYGTHLRRVNWNIFLA